MATTDPANRVRRLPADRDNLATAIARLEVTVGGMREDVSEIKASVKDFDHRLSFLEDVRVKAIEEREIRRQAIAEERQRTAVAARAAAERAAVTVSEHAKQRIGRLQFWIGIAFTSIVTILAALIASGRI